MGVGGASAGGAVVSRVTRSDPPLRLSFTVALALYLTIVIVPGVVVFYYGTDDDGSLAWLLVGLAFAAHLWVQVYALAVEWRDRR